MNLHGYCPQQQVLKQRNWKQDEKFNLHLLFSFFCLKFSIKPCLTENHCVTCKELVPTTFLHWIQYNHCIQVVIPRAMLGEKQATKDIDQTMLRTSVFIVIKTINAFFSCGKTPHTEIKCSDQMKQMHKLIHAFIGHTL